MKRIKKTILTIVSATILIFMLSGCAGKTSTEDLTGVWIERNENVPIHLELREDGSYYKYQIFDDTKKTMDEGQWKSENHNLIFNTTLGLDGSISDIGLTMKYIMGKGDTETYLKIKSNDDVYFEGIKEATEGNK